MKTQILKTTLGFVLVSALSASAFAADFSKKSDKELIDLAGKVAPKDYPDFKMEVYKRVQEMKVKDAKVFKEQMRKAKREAMQNNTVKKNREYKEAIKKEIDKRLESMTIEEARNSGLLQKPRNFQERDAQRDFRDGRPCDVSCPLNR
ncbi:MAG: DUF1104 domain-containing protein [Helicobacter sp.]|nr:DUF1104 domain-containing protein [Helicobacteraceae bacterium]MDY3113043.1 DUF1104 domain-containing protein [Helicobacter sp.]